jgi:hypothetical protein
MIAAINFADKCNFVQYNVEHIQGWCTANFMTLNSSETRVILLQENRCFSYVYKQYDCIITCMDAVNDRVTT